MTGRRVDANHAEVKAALKAAGCVVVDTHALGQGFPDLVIVRPDGVCALLIEVKAAPSVTRPEVEFMISLVNPVYRIATSPEQAVEIVRGEK